MHAETHRARKHLRAFAQFVPLLDATFAKVDVAVVQLVGVQQLSSLRHDLLNKLMGCAELVLELALLSLCLSRLLDRLKLFVLGLLRGCLPVWHK